MKRNVHLCFALLLLSAAAALCNELIHGGQPADLISSRPATEPTTGSECPPPGCDTRPKPKRRRPPPCWNYTIPQEEYRVLDDGSLLVLVTGVTFPRANYTLEGENTSATLCYPVSPEFRDCAQKWKLEAHEIQISRSGLELWVPIYKKLYTAGEFRLRPDGAVFVCVPPAPTEQVAFGYVYGICWSVSVVSLFLAFVVYWIALPKLKLHDKMLLCHIASLFLVYLLFVLRLWGPRPGMPACMAYGILIHFSFLSSFFWINVLAFDIWKAFPNLQTNMADMGKNVSDTFRFILHCLYAWGVPLLIVCVAIMVDTLSKTDHVFKPSYKINCWLQRNYSRLVYFYGPAAVILVSNVVFFGLTVWNLRQMGKDASMANKKIHRQLMHLYLKLVIIMGLCWIMEVVSWAVNDNALYWHFTDIINALQGFFIFLIYVCKRNILTSLRRVAEKNWVCCRRKMVTSIYHTKTSSSNAKDGESFSEFNYSTSTQISNVTASDR